MRDALAGEERPNRDQATAALVAYLSGLLERIESDQERVVLHVVLGLDEKYWGLKARERQAIAGELIRDGREILSANTIRQDYLRDGLQKLYHLILEDEGLPVPADDAASGTDEPQELA